ncbi:pentatricopeptide repeat-containing protein At2g13600-like [Nymphaea colorata]|nr:pentatricopeptide repeat-containing protein At2g13600-like [Nymphaea colorata]XP_049931734.1 pentatricopeptide repeat-containing protein At2g13600-like [Nymphaea colorata]XP_049931735.1 pentatricopeptide repeat-containing protein At2g13600-like [Nymphaea colorata]
MLQWRTGGEVALVRLLKASCKEGALRKGKSVHAVAAKLAYDRFLCVGNALINVYVRCGNLDSARKVFEEIPERDVLSWTSLVAGCAQGDHHRCLTSISIFRQMVSHGFRPNPFTFASVLKACGKIRDPSAGKSVHGLIVVSGCVPDVVLMNSILAMYGNCGCFDEAQNVFNRMLERDVISWNKIIDAHVQNGDMKGALEFFHRSPFCDVVSWNTIISGYMHNGDDRTAVTVLYDMKRMGVDFNEFTLCISLVLAAKLAILDLGEQVHCQLFRKLGGDYDWYIGNSLIDMYCKCGKLDVALLVFETNFGAASWSSLVSAYTQNGRSEDAVNLFRRMLDEGVPVDNFTLAAVAIACAESGILEQAKQIHAQIVKYAHTSDSVIESSMINMYSKCGSIDDARLLFNKTKEHGLVSWTSMILGCAFHGLAREAIQLFEKMLKEGVRPNEISFLGVLSACCHAGLLNEGCHYFKLMREDCSILPKIEHFTCMVDLLGRLGQLEVAEEFILENAIGQADAVWKALLSACSTHKNVLVGERALGRLFELEPCDDGSYVILSNMWSTSRKWENAADVRQLMQKKQMRKKPGCSWIVLKKEAHIFVMGDRSHPQTDAIYSSLACLAVEASYYCNPKLL